jgi:hypothetical protein
MATELNERKYPVSGESQPEKYGQVVRVAGNSGGSSPNKWAKHFDDQGIQIIVDPKGKEEAAWRSLIEKSPYIQQDFEKYRFVPNLDGLVVRSVIDLYHVNTQEGLNALADAIRSF